jgi:propionyl-CoA carboxylase beta chain
LKVCLANICSHRVYSELQDIEEHTAEYTSRFANPLVAAQRGFVDDVIDPQDTRKIICNDLKVLRTKKMPDIPKKHSNIPL